MTKTLKKPQTIRQHLYEEAFVGSNVDREAGVIRDVKVLGNISRNGREYSESAKRDAVKILEGITVNLDHNRDNPKRERGFMEGIGTLHGLHCKPDGVYAREFQVKKSHPSANLIFESAERFPKNFGMSINADGAVVRRGGKWIVESIVNPQSVDIVSRPATTDGLFESVSKTGKGASVVKRTVKGLLESFGTPEQKGRLAKLLEASGGDAAMVGQPVDVPPMATDPEYADDGSVDPDSLAADPMDQINEAFASLVVSVMENAALDLKTKISQITTILTTQDELINGAAAAPAKKAATTPVKEDDQSNDDSEGDENMQESLKPIQTALDSLVESTKALTESQKRSDAKFLLMESNIEVSPTKIDAILAAKDEPAVKLLLESWPPKTKPTVQRPQMKSLQESQGPTKFSEDLKSFVSSIRD